MDNRLLRVCQREYAREVKAAFEANPLKGKYLAVVPFVGGLYDPRNPRQERAAMQRTARALLAKRWFEEDGPEWAQPLPIRSERYCRLQQSADNKQQLLGYYGQSLEWLDWKFQQHPSFDVFCRGAMAAPRCESVAHLLDDPELRRMFPPKELAGFSVARMYWS